MAKRRQINQGFFAKLLIDEDGSVERAELTEPFAALLAPSWQGDGAGRPGDGRHGHHVP